MVYTRKAISPVVATALLLVVAVVAVVGFQSWFTTYQSGVNSKVEQDSASGSVIYVERLEAANGTIFIKNAATDPMTISNKTKVVDKDGNSISGCGKNDGLTPYIAASEDVTTMEFDAPGCVLTKGSRYDVVVVTDDGVFTFTQIAR